MSGKRSTVLAVICIFAITAAVLFLKRPADPSGQEADIDLGAYVWQKPFDLDGDDVPELLLIRNSSHPDGVTICTYRGGKAVLQREIGSFGTILYYPETKLIGAFYGNHGCYSYYTFRLEEDGLRLQPFVFIDDAAHETERFYFYVFSEEELGRMTISYDTFFNTWLNEIATEMTEEQFREKWNEYLGREVMRIPYDLCADEGRGA